MIIDIMLHRFEFTFRWSKGKVLDVGCADAAQWKFPMAIDAMTNPMNISSITLADCDEWKNDLGFPFLRCFAEDIPKPDKSFDTVIFGDILEHVNDPNKVLKEGMRLTSDRILVTVPLEFEWEKNNPNIKAFETREKHLKDGKNLSVLGFDSTIRHPSGKCIDALDDVINPHIHHCRFFTQKTFVEFLEENLDPSWNYQVYRLRYSPFNFVALAAAIWRKKEDDTDYSIMNNREDIKTK